MPAHYMTYPNAPEPILPVEAGATSSYRGEIRLDQPYLASFGSMRVPIHLWLAAQRFAVWIEPAIIAEWKRVTHSYAEKQGRTLDESQLSAAMVWEDPVRDVKLAKERAERLLVEQRLYCVWSGKRLSADKLDMDHCFPWAVWPCGDLWNLLPAHRTVNQHEQRDLLPSDRRLRAAQERILDWWRDAYRTDPGHPLAKRFMQEAAASLPGILAVETNLDDCYSALQLQRLRLSQNQQIPEWSGEQYL